MQGSAADAELEAHALKAYLSVQLEPICDADPVVLADYIIALLRHDKGEAELKVLCAEQLEDFLHPGATEGFLDSLFDVLKSKAYLSSVAPAVESSGDATEAVAAAASPSRGRAPPSPAAGQPTGHHQHAPQHPTPELQQEQQHPSSYPPDERLHHHHQQQHQQYHQHQYQQQQQHFHHQQYQPHPHPPPYMHEQQRYEPVPPSLSSSQRRGRDDMDTGHSPGGPSWDGDRQHHKRFQPSHHQAEAFRDRREGAGRRDGEVRRDRGTGSGDGPDRRRREEGGRSGDAGASGGRAAYSDRPAPGPEREPRGKYCFQFAGRSDPAHARIAQGFCSKGDTCRYEHIARPAEQVQRPPFQDVPYRPAHAASPGAVPMRSGSVGPGPGAGRRGQGPPPPRSLRRNTIVVENIPPARLEIEQINAHFRRFGTITNIKLEPTFQRATLTYSQVQEASAALNCPDVIFENRFVKVHLLREEVVMPHPELAAPPSDPTSITEVTATSLRRVPVSTTAAAAAGAGEGGPERKPPAITTTAQLLQVQKSQEALIAKQLAESKRIMEKLSSGHLSDADRKMLLLSLKALSGATQQGIQTSQLRLSKATAASPTALPSPVPMDIVSASSPATESGAATPAAAGAVTVAPAAGAPASEVDPLLKAKLEALQQEAKTLGVRIPGATAAAAGAGGPTSAARRGGYHPYAGGGRGSHSWMAGGGRGGSQPPNFQRTFNLDMRPKQIRVAGPDLSSISADLVEHYQAMPECTGVEMRVADGCMIVSYASRRAAERAMAAPFDVAGLTSTWYATPAAPAANVPPAAAPMVNGDGPSATATAAASSNVLEAAGGAGLGEEEEDEADMHEEVNWKRRG